MENQALPRDVFIDEVFNAAKADKNIVFLTCDLGAKALDRFRVELPAQCIHTGISEQNMMDVAAGLSQCGKNVYTYAMAPFATFRCFEQIKVALGAMKQPVTIIGVGVGFGYDDAGPTHYATEDLSCMRTIAGLEIVSPADNHTVRAVAQDSIQRRALRYVRLDRKFLSPLYHNRTDFVLNKGLIETAEGGDLAIVACGFTVHTALAVRNRLKEHGISCGVVDLFRLTPLNANGLVEILGGYKKVATLEEHFLSGGLGSAVLECLNDLGQIRTVLRLGVKEHYFFENGGRKNAHVLSGIDQESVYNRLRNFV